MIEYNVIKKNSIQTLVWLLVAILPLSAQTPFDQLQQNFTNVYLGSARWVDYNNDGYLDFFVTGWRSQGGSTSAPTSALYRNNGDGTFTEVTTSITPLGASAAAWADVDNDGYIDLAIAGNAGGGSYDARIFKNNGDGSFSDMLAGLVPINTPTLAWGDLNKDGLTDLIAAGSAQDGSAITTIYYNNGDHSFTAQSAGLPQLTQAAAAIADMNLDGWNDIILCGRVGTGNYLSQFFLNNGDGSFSLAFSFEPARYPSIDVADVDDDGLPDVVIQGGNNSDVLHTSVYRNLGGALFELIPNNVAGVYQGFAAFGDYNNDGSSDLAVTGSTVPTGATRITKLYSNQGSGVYAEVPEAVFPGLRRSMMQWGDMHNDGKLDLLIIGYFNPSDYMTRVYVNQLQTANTPPTAPTNLQVQTIGNEAIFEWQPSSDMQTSSASLTYNLRVGTYPGGNDVLAAHALPNGKLTLPRIGNQGQRLSGKLKNLANGTYYWSVQAIDAGFMGSVFASEQSFTIGSASSYEVTFQINSDGQPIEGVLVETPAGNVVTNFQGIAVITLPEGTHPWYATKEGFKQAYGEVVVNQPTVIQLSLETPLFQTLPLVEQFNDPTQPSGWYNQTQNNNFARWAFDGISAKAGSGTDPVDLVHAWLTSPVVYTEGLTGVLKLSFSHRLSITEPGAAARIYVYKETQSLPVWELLAEYVSGTGGPGIFTDVELPITVNSSATSVVLRFEFEESEASRGLWEINQLELAYQPIGPHEVQLLSLRPSPNIQTPWFIQSGYIPAGTIKNIGSAPIQNLSLEVKYNNSVVGQSGLVYLAPGQMVMLETSAPFVPPSGPGTFVLDFTGVAPGIDLASPNNQKTYQLVLTDSTFAQDYGTSASQLSVNINNEFGHIFDIRGFRNASLIANSVGIHWGAIQEAAGFRFRIYRLATGTNNVELLEYESALIQISAVDAGQYRIYTLSNPIFLELNTRYAITLYSSDPLHLMADGLNKEGYFKKVENSFVTVSSMHGAPMLRMNVQLVGGMADRASSGIIIYPNPARNSAMIKNLHDETLAIVYGQDGKEKMRLHLSGPSMEISLQTLAPGLYFIRLPESGKSVRLLRLP